VGAGGGRSAEANKEGGGGVIKTIEDLVEAYVRGDVTDPLILDNDHVSVNGRNGQVAFVSDPWALLRALLDDAGIPWDEA
jgi:hypothetical protein